MSLKGTIKKVIGEQRLSDAKGQIMHYVTSAELEIKKNPKIKVNEEKFKIAYHLNDQNYHVFRGYYDLAYMDDKKSVFLAHRLPIKAENNRGTKIEIGYYDLETQEFHKVDESSAWCWQQGSRLRFHPLNQNLIMFNDVEGNDYCTRVIDYTTGEGETINSPLYDVSPDFTWGVSLNYSRLQRMRPGYGYNYFSDSTKGINAPENDGIFIVDIKTNKKALKYSLRKLMLTAELSEEYEYYLNHVSISPDGSRYIFFLIYTKPGVKAWGTVLFVSDDDLSILENTDRVSHYCWIDNDHVMVTCHREDGSEYYCIYDVKTGDKRILNIQGLTVDGHPSPLNGGFITDTYPLEKSLQRVKLFNQSSTMATTVASFYHDYRLRGEKRCDLHPVVERSGEFISVDTTYNERKRSIIILKNLGD